METKAAKLKITPNRLLFHVKHCPEMKPQIIARRKIDRKIDRLQKQDADKAHIAECAKMAQRLKSEIAKGNRIVINYAKNVL